MIAKTIIPKHIYLFGDLRIAAFDDDGKQIPVLQKSVADLLAAEAERHGISTSGAVIHTQNAKSYRFFRDAQGTIIHEVLP